MRKMHLRNTDVVNWKLHYACNKSSNASGFWMTDDSKRINCKNCKRILKRLEA